MMNNDDVGTKALEAETGTSSGVESNIPSVHGSDVVQEQAMNNNMEILLSTIAKSSQVLPNQLSIEDHNYHSRPEDIEDALHATGPSSTPHCRRDLTAHDTNERKTPQETSQKTRLSRETSETLGRGGYVLPLSYGGISPFVDIGLNAVVENANNSARNTNVQSERLLAPRLKTEAYVKTKIPDLDYASAPGASSMQYIAEEKRDHVHHREQGTADKDVQRLRVGGVGTGGFRSEPWTSPDSPVRASPEARADDLLQNMDLLGFDRMRVNVHLDSALDEQKCRNQYSMEVSRLSPAALDLLQTKNLVTVPANNKIDNLFRRECLSLAISHADLKSTSRDKILTSLEKTRHDVLNQIRDDRIHEATREAKVIEAAEKTRRSKERVKRLLLEKGETAVLKESNMSLIREEALRKEAKERAIIAQSKLRAAKVKKEKILEDKKKKQELLERLVFSKMDEVTKLQAQKQTALDERNAAKAYVRTKKIEEKCRSALEAEENNLEEKKRKIHLKDWRFAKASETLANQRLRERGEKQAKLLEHLFRAEQRRKMIDDRRESEQELGRIKTAKEAVLAATRAETNARRPIRLNRIYAEQLKKGIAKSSYAAAPLDETPGPGAYFQAKNTKPLTCKGGYLASSRVEPPPREVPGPGHYEANELKKSGTGCIPFMGRGKTDVDWTIATAAKLPGVGSYNIQSRAGTKRSVTLTSKGTSELDKVISKAKKVPGPGDYNVNQDTTPAPNSVEAYVLGLDSGYAKKLRS